MRFIDLFAGIGGFHKALLDLGHECVFASEIDDELRFLYEANFKFDHIHGDIRITKHKVPPHDLLCAGFPCQPFSKSGAQLGTADETRGTLFHEIVEILRLHRPKYVILENVGNFERHDGGRTWRVAKKTLLDLGYDVRGTEHVASGGHGLISPHHFGFPHHRERFFVVASLDRLPVDPFPIGNRKAKTDLTLIMDDESELDRRDHDETRLTARQTECIDHWNKLLKALPDTIELPSLPIWSDEFGARYPFEGRTPFATRTDILRRQMGYRSQTWTRALLMEQLPSYARRPEAKFPDWKIRFIRENRDWYQANKKYFPRGWLQELRKFPPSLRKLEWNCNGDEHDLWNCVLQFRPSGLRAKRFTSVPALVAMTTTQIPILGPRRRFLTRREGLRLQGFDPSHRLPNSRAAAFAALGNAVHVEVVKLIAKWLLEGREGAPQLEAQLEMAV